MKSKEQKDLNYIIIKDSNGHKFFRRSIYSRVVINLLLITLQMVLIAFFVFRLEQYMEVYFGLSIVLSAAFMIYLVNVKGKNEFKIAWFVPMIFVPLFSISAYLIYHTNLTTRHHGKRLSLLRAQSEKLLLDSTLPPPENSNIKDLLFYLSENGGFPAYQNCENEYFSCGEAFFPDLLEHIKSAKKFIFIEFFIIDVDESWAELVEILAQKAKDGVEVRVLCDGFGSPMASTRSYQKYLASRGIHSQVFMPLIPFLSTHLNNRDHRKIVVIDGDVAYTGGLNISNEYFNKDHHRFNYWKDNGVRIKGPAIRTLTALFLQTWNLQKLTNEDFSQFLKPVDKYPPYAQKGLTIPYGDDFFNNKDIAENVYLYIINNAHDYLNITTPYVIVDNQMQEALLFAAARGVKVSIIVPSVPDHFLTFCIGKTFLKTLVDGDIQIFLYDKGFIHEKTFISDDKIATVGSVNLDYRSLFHHFENGVVLEGSPVIAKIKADFESTLADCTQMTRADYKKLPSHIKFLGRLFRIFAPLL